MIYSSFLAGSLPLSFSLSSSQLRLVSTIGMGVLVGTSLIVIIPEGIETIYNAYEVDHSHSRRSSHTRSLDVRWESSAVHAPSLNTDHSKRALDEIDAINALPGPVIPTDSDISGVRSSQDPPKSDAPPGEVHILDEVEKPEGGASEDKPQEDSSNKEDEDHQSTSGKESKTHHAWVGVSLISGFILMYLIDTLPSLKPPQPPQRMNIYSLSDLSSSSSPPATQISKASFSTTLGLVIHSAADGIALGASSTQPSLSAIIFFAIIVHKAPAAFGLTSVLLKQGLSKRQARTHLVAFSFAAPAGALLTWLVVRILGGGSNGGEHMKWWTGVVLLFSGGTFL